MSLLKCSDLLVSPTVPPTLLPSDTSPPKSEESSLSDLNIGLVCQRFRDSERGKPETKRKRGLPTLTTT